MCDDHKYIHIPLCRAWSEVFVTSIIDTPCEDQCEWHRMTINRMTGPDCTVMCVCVFSSHSFWTSSSLDVCVCVCVCFLPIHSGHQWTYQPWSHRRKVTQDFSSTFFLRCVPLFFSREEFSHSFPSSTVKSNFCVLTISSFSTRWHFLVLVLVF